MKKIQQEFDVSEYSARQSKKLVEERGILSLPVPLHRPSLASETVETVHSMNLMTSVRAGGSILHVVRPVLS